MSLDVYLEGPAEATTCRCSECGDTHARVVSAVLYSANITHNLSKMAREAGLYLAIWRPEDIMATNARRIIGRLREGLTMLKADPDRFRLLNPPNGWGSYDGFVPWVEDYIAACEANPDATIRVPR